MLTVMTTVSRGYGAAHRKLRAHWAKRIASGELVFCHARVCLRATRVIWPGSSWHLGHTPDRAEWTGPEHDLCNLSEAGRRGNPKGKPKRRRPAPRWRPTRSW
jgi:hypothetical protein